MFQIPKDYLVNCLYKKNQDPNKNLENNEDDEIFKKKIEERVFTYKKNKNDKDLEVLQQIYNEAYKSKPMDDCHKRFIKSIRSNTQLFNYYSIKQLQEKHKLLKLCSKYREVRGDGNCFYTALGYRFLQILLCEYNLEEFNYFLDKIEQIDLPFKVYCKTIKIPEEIQKNLRNEFLFRLCEIRQIEDKNERLNKLMEQYSAYESKGDIDGNFFALTTIFFRNVSYYVAAKSEFAESIFDIDNLLIWGEECNNNEIVIKELSEFLRVQ
ncbi:unnamed protein product (macronuclear) [Paramecium tetraurelia]|uniref:ubiquitinyl hydrolase 1 n=1 Tax=Paramecium tetraurelia TaxID=5888 RepID=A0CEC1_PARTE|nr:uncharacterized protein GSPATT00037574001 [Paramecium tetraurelia]CAK69138.1 unnamed protein product [Paramecium tetraurelia]|eukprot:XP_001436535.1 hypothetical protein (macronuclear) [Paramecium tetraurelia strain d4-2]